MKRILLFLLCTMGGMKAGAGLHVEPYGGLGLAYTSFDQRSLSIPFMGGVRLGYKVLNVTAGLDAFATYYRPAKNLIAPNVVVTRPSTTAGFNQASENTTIHFSRSSEVPIPVSLGVFGTVGVPLLFDVYGGLFYSTSLNRKYSGPGAKAGITYLSAFFVNLNAELQWMLYSCKGDTCAKKASHVVAVVLSVSMPFSFGLFSGRKSRSAAASPPHLEEASPSPFESNPVQAPSEPPSLESAPTGGDEVIDSLSYE